MNRKASNITLVSSKKIYISYLKNKNRPLWSIQKFKLGKRQCNLKLLITSYFLFFFKLAHFWVTISQDIYKVEHAAELI